MRLCSRCGLVWLPSDWAHGPETALTLGRFVAGSSARVDLQAATRGLGEMPNLALSNLPIKLLKELLSNVGSLRFECFHCCNFNPRTL